jgi:hypothetical protein
MTIITTKTSDGDHGNRNGGRGVLMVIAVTTFVTVLMPLSECFPCHFSFLQLLHIHYSSLIRSQKLSVEFIY